MKVIQKTQQSDIATVYIAKSTDNKMIEFVESIQPPFTLKEKWILMVSMLFGCPGKCKFCDAGGNYQGKLSFEQIMFQIDYMIQKRFPTKNVTVEKFKIQFARMGEPSFNDAVLEVLKALPQKYNFKTFIPSVSTIAPRGTERFFQSLTDLKNSLYPENFQLQFSIHSTDEKQRDYLMPIKKWGFQQIADYGNNFYNEGNRKITLNFALGRDSIIKPEILTRYFDPDIFLIKITPVNPTYNALANNIKSDFGSQLAGYEIIDKLEEKGYQVILSIGELEENKIGSNCGQFIHSLKKKMVSDAYSYELENV